MVWFGIDLMWKKLSNNLSYLNPNYLSYSPHDAPLYTLCLLHPHLINEKRKLSWFVKCSVYTKNTDFADSMDQFFK